MQGAAAGPAVEQGVRVTLADPGLRTRSPGEEFAWAMGGVPAAEDRVVPFRPICPRSSRCSRPDRATRCGTC